MFNERLLKVGTFLGAGELAVGPNLTYVVIARSRWPYSL